MSKRVRKLFNVRIILLLTCIIVFILLNSTQESFVQISDMASTTLVTTDTGTESFTDTYSELTPTGPTFPTYNPPDTNNNGGIIDGGNRPMLPAQVIPIIIGTVIGVLIIALLLQRRRAEKSSGYFKQLERSSPSIVRRKREKFRTQISTLVEILTEYLEEGKYTEGVIYGYHQLDKNTKRILGTRRETYLTPKEFASSLELPEIIVPLKWIVETFYVARYRISPMGYEDLKEFIIHLQTLKEMSKSGADIKIIRRDIDGDEE